MSEGITKVKDRYFRYIKDHNTADMVSWRRELLYWRAMGCLEAVGDIYGMSARVDIFMAGEDSLPNDERKAEAIGGFYQDLYENREGEKKDG